MDYDSLVTKRDLNKAKSDFEALIVNALINLENYGICYENVKKKLENFKDDVDNIVEEAVKNAE